MLKAQKVFEKVMEKSYTYDGISQPAEGVVIAKSNRGLHSSFIVRKISHGVGVERTFQLHSPLIDSITVKRRGDVRKAKLYHLRELSGKAARIREKLDVK